MKKVLVDAHTHTIASGHAYSSLQEMVQAAADKGLEVLGITEHGPSVPGTRSKCTRNMSYTLFQEHVRSTTADVRHPALDGMRN